MQKLIETDLKTFVKFWLVPFGIVLVLIFLQQALTGLVVIGVSIFLALALRPLVGKVNRFFVKHFGTEKKHRGVSVALAYLIVVTVIGGVIAVVGPVVVNETAKFIQNFPETFEKTFGGWEGINNFGRSIGISDLQSEITSSLKGLSSNLLGVLGSDVVASVGGVADAVMKIVLVLVLSLLFLVEGPGLVDVFWKSLGAGGEDRRSLTVARRILSKMANVVSTYVSRQALVAVIDGIASGTIVFCLSLFLGLSSSLAIPMGMVTMVFYMIPMFGQFIGGTLVTLVLLVSSPVAAAVFAVIYIIYAQIENNVISPKIQGNALNLPAVMILCAITIGMYMFGLLGALIAIPIAGCVRILMDEYPNIKALRRRDG